MDTIQERIQKIDWEKVKEQMHENGFAILPGLLDNQLCDTFKSLYDIQGIFRKVVPMERFRFGIGEYKYFDYPLPPQIMDIRTHIYSQIAPIANAWFNALKIPKHFPKNHAGMLERYRHNQQEKAAVLILKYPEKGYNTLHQDLYGDEYFPIQCVCFLDGYGIDYEGGEFVITEQIPRAQSKAIVLTPKKGDMLLFATNFRPKKGKRGYYRVKMKHGVSQLHKGQRHTLGIIFHDAAK